MNPCPEAMSCGNRRARPQVINYDTSSETTIRLPEKPGPPRGQRYQRGLRCGNGILPGATAGAADVSTAPGAVTAGFCATSAGSTGGSTAEEGDSTAFSAPSASAAGSAALGTVETGLAAAFSAAAFRRSRSTLRHFATAALCSASVSEKVCPPVPSATK